ncbi:hypothetical protein P3S67_021082 [Capsicum chacoense]
MLQPPKSPPPSSKWKYSEQSVKKQKVNKEEDAEGEKPQLPSSPPSEGENESESDSSESENFLSSESDADEESSDFKTLDPLPMDGSHIKYHHFLPHKDVGYFSNPGDIECWNKYVDQIEESEGTTYEVNEIIRVNEDGCRDVTYYITLLVKNGESEYCQVKVVDRLHKSLKVLIVKPRVKGSDGISLM